MTPNQQKINAMTNEDRIKQREENMKRLFTQLKKQDLSIRDATNILGFTYDSSYQYLRELERLGAANKIRKHTGLFYAWTGKQLAEFPKRTKSEIKNINTYRRALRILDLQNRLTEKPETIAEICKRLQLNHCTTTNLLKVLHEAFGCRLTITKDTLGRARTYMYFKDADVVPYDVGSPIEIHADSRDGWKPAEMPTDDQVLNALIGYTEYTPPRGRVFEMKNISPPLRKVTHGICSAQVAMELFA